MSNHPKIALTAAIVQMLSLLAGIGGLIELVFNNMANRLGNIALVTALFCLAWIAHMVRISSEPPND